MRRTSMALALAVVGAADAAGAAISDIRTVQTLLFRAVGDEANVLTMTGDRVVPPSGSFENGTATISYADPNLSFNITHGVIGETQAAIRGPAYAYENAGIQFLLPPGSPKIGSVMLSAAQEIDLLAGRLYIEIRSATFPNGAIRTQIQAVNPAREGSPVWVRVQVQNLGPDPYDGVDGLGSAFRLPGLARVPASRGLRVTVDIDEPGKPQPSWPPRDRILATTSNEFQVDIPVLATIEFDLGYVPYFPSIPNASTTAVTETDSLNFDPNPENNTLNSLHPVLGGSGESVPAAGAGAILVLAGALGVIAHRSRSRRRSSSAANTASRE